MPQGMRNERKVGRLPAARDGKKRVYEPLLTVLQDFYCPVYAAKRLH